jgi:hypothetical protein
MVPNITTILPCFPGEWAMLLPSEAILTICREMGYTAWRDRVRTPLHYTTAAQESPPAR